VSARRRIVDLVFERPEVHPLKRGAIALVIAVAVHAAAWVWALLAEASLETWSAQVAARVHAELTREEIVELPEPAKAKPPPEPPAPQPVTEVEPEPTPRVARAAEPPPEDPPEQPPPPPIEPGKVIAREEPTGPVDLTGFDIASGESKVYAPVTVPGGVKIEGPAAGPTVTPVPTAEGGPSRSGSAGPPSGPPAAGARDRSRAVRLSATEWSCPWPPEADTEAIDEQTVVIRVVVRADGTAESAKVLHDPGYGFGPAATACALETHFDPALDREGRPVRAPSPPIRVRFTR
jgi:protein TonB